MSENEVKVWQATDLHNAEMLKGKYVRHVYPWHSHEALSLGVVIDGAINLRTSRRSGTASRGWFVLINEDEMHYGAPATPVGWRCRTIHLHPSAIRNAAEQFKGPLPTVAFRGPTFEDEFLVRALIELHHLSEDGGTSLDRQSRILGIIARLLRLHAETSVAAPRGANEPVAVRRARVYLDENLSDKVTLGDLAEFAGTTPFRLLRAFQRSLGLTPHSYQVQARVRVAHGLLQRQESLAEVAAAAGFADQAHLTRVFKSIMGATPGQYRAAAAGKLGS